MSASKEDIENAYKTGYCNSAAMHSLSDENVKEEMEVGWKSYQEFLKSLSERR